MISVRKLDGRTEITRVALGVEGGLGKASVRGRVGLSRKSPYNRHDLSDDLGINPIPELLRAERPARIAVNDETALLQSTPAAQIAAISFENEIDRLLAGGVRCGLGGLLHPPVDDYECGIDEPGMDGRLVSSHPVKIGKREVLEPGKFPEECLRKSGTSSHC